MSILGCFVISSAVSWCVEESENDNINMPSVLSFSVPLPNPRSLCVVIYGIVVEPDVVIWLEMDKLVSSSRFERELVSSPCFLYSQLDQIPAFAFPITFLMCPLWEYDTCGADSHKSVTSEIKETGLLMSPWLKLLHSGLFTAFSFTVHFHHLFGKINPY